MNVYVTHRLQMTFVVDCVLTATTTAHAQLDSGLIGYWKFVDAQAFDPFPIDAKTLAMPIDDRLWFDDDEGRPSSSPQTQQPSPKDAVAWTQLGAFAILLENGQLLTECQVLSGQTAPRNKPRSKK